MVTDVGSETGEHGARRRALLALLLLVPVPSIGTALGVAVPATAGEWTGSLAFAAAKVWLVVLPAAWYLGVERGSLSLSPLHRGGLGVGLLLGAAIGVAILAAYVTIGRIWIDAETLRAGVRETGLDRPLTYVTAGVLFCTVNAVMEEYVWRWFVFRQFERLVPAAGGWIAVLLAAAAFTAHHVIALRAHFGWDVTVLGSAGVFIGGVVWSWCYRRYRSIWPGYLSHVVADVVIFAIGWRILFGG